MWKMSILETLKENRTPILLAEIGAYLHDLGKATREFIESAAKEERKEGQATGSSISHSCPSLFPEDLKKLLSKTKVKPEREGLRMFETSLWDFIEYHHSKQDDIPELVKLIRAKDKGFDGIDSGVDKGNVREKQKKDYTFISNAFGFEEYWIEYEKIDKIKEKLHEKIREYLEKYNREEIDIEVLRKKIFQETREIYLKFLGETRRPANDVTLWDHSYSVATMMKCAMAEMLLNPSKLSDPFDPLCFSWKVLAVNFDILELLSKGMKIGDIYGYWKTIELVFEEIKEMIEVTYPVGNEIYRDTKGIYFLVANEELKELKMKILDKIKEIEPEIVAYITEISSEKIDCPPREDGNKRREVEEKKKEFLKKSIPEAKKMALKHLVFPVYSEGFPHSKFSIEPNEEVCPICRVRTVEKGKEICTHCSERRIKRSHEWINDQKHSIWIDEIADHNDRVALLVGMIKIDNWLDGNFIQTLTFCEPKNNVSKKFPSPARIRRIWETTENFIKVEVTRILEELPRRNDIRTKRIRFEISSAPSIPEGSTCDVIVDGVRFSPVCIDNTKGIFISTTNLEILSKFGRTVEEIAEALSGQNIKLKTEEEKNWKDYMIIEAKPADDEFQDYIPYIEIYDFPDQFMILVPAYEALDIAEKILMEYEKQFSKVRDRLPFHLGVIAFHRRTPLYIVMDAARRLLKRFEMSKTIEADVIKVEDIAGDSELGKCKKLVLQVDRREIPLNWVVSYSTKDPEVEDLWYPYLRICSAEKPDRTLCFDYTGSGDYVVHIKEIKEKDRIKIEPSYFKLCYIEESSDRFNVDENLKFIDDIHHIKNLWEMVKRNLLSKKWTLSQLYSFWKELERIKEYDEETFEYFLESNLINILGLNPSSDEFEFLKKAIEDGLFELCLHWNLQVRKEKAEKGADSI